MLAAVAIGLLAQQRFHPPEKLEIIPVKLVSMPAPPPPVRQSEPEPPRPEKQEIIPDPLEKPPPKKPPEKPPEPEVKPVEKEQEPQPEATEKIGKVDAPPTPVVSDRPTIDSEMPVQVELEGPPFEYGYYIQAIREKIAANWDVPEATDGVAARVRFRIERNGKVVDAEIVESSGNPLFDTSALRALLKASPLPQLPPKYPQDWLGVRLQFIYQE